MLEEGASFAVYDVQRRLAVGGMGEVYLCRHRLLERLDAVKVLRPHLAADELFRKRFLREALSAARLRHPHVVTVYTADEAEGHLYLAMEYIDGVDLYALLRRERMAPTRTVAMLRQAADALDGAHRMRMVHRDVKPSNLLVTDAGGANEQIYLCDFGISKEFDSRSDLTRAGETIGTPAYCAPEQLLAQDVDGATDQYSLACVGYEMLTGQLLFPRENSMAMISAHLTLPPPKVSALRPDLPRAVDAVFDKALAKAPRERFATCIDFVEALAAALAPAPPRPAAAPVQAPPHGYRAPAAPPRGPTPPVRPQGTAAYPVAGGWPAQGRPPTAVARAHPPAPVGPPAPVAPHAPSMPPPVLAVVGGPDSGQLLGVSATSQEFAPLVGLEAGTGDAPPRLRSVDGALWLAGDGRVQVNGQRFDGARQLRDFDLVACGAALLQVRPAGALGASPREVPLPDAVALSTLPERGLAQALRPAGHPNTLWVRLGWRPGPTPHAPLPAPLAFGLAVDGAFVVRGQPEATAPLLRWLITQCVTLHAPRDLCLVAALGQTPSENWQWLNWLPHARPTTPPISGLHAATRDTFAADLGVRLWDLVKLRVRVAGDARAVYPRVLAVLDERLDPGARDIAGSSAGRYGVHIVYVTAPEVSPPPGAAAVLDVDADGRGCRLLLPGAPAPVVGVPDGVSTAYARGTTSLLPDD
jgi:tRNA A-37 threonylcarbamoyl transferase component Bud32